jgi:hypothetical protein
LLGGDSVKVKILILKLIPILGFFIYAFIWFTSHLFTGRLFKEIKTWNRIGLSWIVLIIVFMILYGGPSIYIDSIGVSDKLEVLLIVWFVVAGIFSNIIAFKVLDKITGDEIVL